MAESDLNTTTQMAASRRGMVELVPVTDERVALVLAQTEACLCGEMDGPLLFAIGSSCAPEWLAGLATREGINPDQALAFMASMGTENASIH
jgi:hypothetical protein